ncbi:transposase [Kribbella alba]|uniref:transposase n=1 Tax=Kribbella alba TaxID=190197 RepID=UPI003CD060D1
MLAYFTTGGVNNGGTEAINGVIEKTRRLAHGFRNAHRLPPTQPARGRRNPPLRRTPTHAQFRRAGYGQQEFGGTASRGDETAAGKDDGALTCADRVRDLQPRGKKEEF